jgi:hypothetical protein
MNRPNRASQWAKAWYIPSKAAVGNGVADRYGRLYIVYRDGSLRKIKDAIIRTIVD